MSWAAQDDFARALLERKLCFPTGLTAMSGSRGESRFAVHRNNVMASLIAALASRFPAAERVVGTAFFAAMARAYIYDHPPRSPVLLQYGDDLAGFIERFAPAADVPYLADVVRLEAARGKAYHAADAPTLDPTTLAAVPPERMAGLVLALHPAASVVRSAHPVVTIWAMNTGEAEPSPVDRWVGEDALVTRPHLTVEIRCLPAGGGVFLSAILAGAILGEAIDAAFRAVPGFDLTANLVGMLQAGVVTAIQ